MITSVPYGQARIVPLATIDADVWDNVVSPERRTPMQHHIWVRAAAKALSPEGTIKVAVVGPLQRPFALAPLMPSTSGGTSRLQLLGADELGESVEVMYRDEASLGALATVMARTGRPLSLGHYLSATPFVAALRGAYRGRGLVVMKSLPMRASPYITLNDSWREPESHFEAGRRSDFRRMRRNADKLGKVEIEILTPKAEDLSRLRNEAIAVEEMGWKGRGRTAIVHDAKLARFFDHYTELACDAGILRLCFLRIDGRAVAMQIAVEADDRLWLLKIGYDENYKRCSPGNILMRETIRDAAQRKLKSYEFLGKEAPWTKLWTLEAHPVAALRVYPVNFLGIIAAAADTVHVARQRFDAIASRRSSLGRVGKSETLDA